MASHSGGGFILSPPPPSIASSSTPTLPHPRSTPLKPGGTKESSFIRYVDQRILHIQRRFAKRDQSLEQNEGVKEVDEAGRVIEDMGETDTRKAHSMGEEWHDVGYTSFAEAAKDTEEVVDVVWISGTPSLQTPYLISLALLTSTMIPAFPASPRASFQLSGKLDHAFASLLQGRDIETGEQLPGFIGRRGVSGTEKVRIKSLVERTRVCVVETMSKGEFEEEQIKDVDMLEDTTDAEDGGLVLENPDESDMEDEMEQASWDMKVAKVYDKTSVELGDSMDGPAIGIRTEMTG